MAPLAVDTLHVEKKCLCVPLSDLLYNLVGVLSEAPIRVYSEAYIAALIVLVMYSTGSQTISTDSSSLRLPSWSWSATTSNQKVAIKYKKTRLEFTSRLNCSQLSVLLVGLFAS